MKNILIVLITILNFTSIMAQKSIKFKVIGGYQFAEGFSIQNGNPFIYAQAGQLTGSWHWEFDNGKIGNTHVNGATANRILPNGKNELFGTMKINMFELENSNRDEDLLFLSYSAPVFKLDGSKVTIKVVGEFAGGTGKYKNANGYLTVTSVNGFFENGMGELFLEEQPTISKEQVKQWTENYFKATQSGDAKVWASSFADYVYINDPYGADIPNGMEEIIKIGEGFMSSFKTAGLYPDWIFVQGLVATSKWTGKATTKEGKKATFEGINVTTYNSTGKIVSHIGYWTPEDMKIE
jgi:hypothetical protein